MNATTTTILWIQVLILSFGIFIDLIPSGIRTAFYGGAWILILIQSVQGLANRDIFILKQSSVLLMVGFLFIMGINIFISIDSAITIQRLFALTINIFIAYYLSVRSSTDLTLTAIANAFRNVLVITSIFTLLMYFVDASTLIDQGENSNLRGTFKGLFPMKNVLGRFMVMFILFELSRKRINYFLIALASFWLVVSQSATGLVAAATLIPIMLTTSLSSNKRLATILLISMALVLVFFPIILDLDYVKVILSEYLDKSADLSGRTTLWPYVIEAAIKRPWFGYGFSAFWESPDAYQQVLQYFNWSPGHAHNGFIQLLIDFGLLGAIPLLFAYLRVSKYAIELYSKRITVAFSFCYILLVFNFSQSELVGRNSFTFIFFAFLYFLSRRKYAAV